MLLMVSAVVARSLTRSITNAFWCLMANIHLYLSNMRPEWVKRWTNTPAGGGFAPGKEALCYKFDLGKVAPLICFECISPEHAAASARNGGEVFVNISDLAWFHKSDCGRQMVAFSVLRAIENRRYFIFGANTGPAAIIDATGKITQYIPQSGAVLVQGKFGLNGQHTFFMDACR